MVVYNMVSYVLNFIYLYVILNLPVYLMPYRTFLCQCLYIICVLPVSEFLRVCFSLCDISVSFTLFINNKQTYQPPLQPSYPGYIVSYVQSNNSCSENVFSTSKNDVN